MSSLLNVYHTPSAPARAIAANARDLYLRWWRYGQETPALVARGLEQEE